MFLVLTRFLLSCLRFLRSGITMALTLTNGDYLFRVQNEMVLLCEAALWTLGWDHDGNASREKKGPEKRNAKDVFINYSDECVSFWKWRIPTLFLLLWKLGTSCSSWSYETVLVGAYIYTICSSVTLGVKHLRVMESKLCVGAALDLSVWHLSVTS